MQTDLKKSEPLQTPLSRALRCLTSVVLVNGSLIGGWGGLSYYYLLQQLALSILLTVECCFSVLSERTDYGSVSASKQGWIWLLTPLWLAMNYGMSLSAHTGKALYADLPVLARWVGVLVFALGLCIRIWSVRSLGHFFTPHLTVYPEQSIVTHGAYAFCRHPAYLATNIQLLGLTLVFPSWIALGGWVAFAVFISKRIKNEEALLQTHFPSDYAIYCQHVPCLFPVSR